MSFFRWSRVCSKGDVAALLQIIEENGAETVVTLKNVAGWTLLYHTAMELGKPSGFLFFFGSRIIRTEPDLKLCYHRYFRGEFYHKQAVYSCHSRRVCAAAVVRRCRA